MAKREFFFRGGGRGDMLTKHWSSGDYLIRSYHDHGLISLSILPLLLMLQLTTVKGGVAVVLTSLRDCET